MSGLLLAAALPKPGVWATSWVGLAPLFVAIRGTRPRQAALYGLITGLVYYSIIIFWFTEFGYLPWVASVLVCAAFMSAFSAAAGSLMADRRAWLPYLAVPAAWTAMQWARCFGLTAFNWGGFAHTQASNLPIAQLSAITGPWGIEFLVCLVNLALAEVALPATGKRKLAPAIVTLALTLAVAGGGGLALRSAPDYHPKTKVTIIQGNVIRNMDTTGRDVYYSFLTYKTMSQVAAMDKPDFIVWPETTISSNIRDKGIGRYLSELARQTHTNYVIGAYDPSDDPKIKEAYNSAFFYGRNGEKLGVCHKVWLVPYGEYVPLRKQMPWLARYGIRDVDVLPGKRHELVKTEIGKVGTSICFESLFPWITSGQTRRGADLLFVITNDSWFKRTQAARQHLMMSQLRAIENRRYIVRGASTGISAIIDPYGRITSELGVYKQGTLTGRVAPLHSLTPYVRFGEYMAYACAAITLLALAVCRRSKPTA